MQWFRWYNGTVADPKLGGIARRCGEEKSRVIAVWAAVLESANSTKNRGRLQTTDEEIAGSINCDVESVSKVIHALRDRGMIKGNFVTAFNARNPKRDDSAGRVRRYRQKIVDNGGTVEGYRRHFAALMARDGGCCVYCGATKPLCLDHMVPIRMGGDDDESNLAVACKACNSAKSGRTPEQAGIQFRVDATDARDAYHRSVQRLMSPPSHAPVTRRHGDSNAPVTPRTEQIRAEQIRTEQKKKTSRMVAGATDEQFNEFWSAFPKRSGSNPRKRAVAAWSARRKEGVDPAQLIAGAKRYAAWCAAEQKTGTQFVMQAATFLGPDERWKESWDESPAGADDEQAYWDKLQEQMT